MLCVDVRKIQALDTIELRHRILWPNASKDDMILPEDCNALHFGAFHKHNLVGVGSFFQENTAVRLRKLAVETVHQGKGVASQILETAIPHLRAQGCTELWCDARVSASLFYARNGFQLGTTPFQKKGLDYVVARRNL